MTKIKWISAFVVAFFTLCMLVSSCAQAANSGDSSGSGELQAVKKVAGITVSDGTFSIKFGSTTSQGTITGSAGKLSDGNFTWSAVDAAVGAVNITIQKGVDTVNAVLIGGELIIDAQ